MAFIKIKKDDTEYTLEFSRNTIRETEKNGFDFTDPSKCGLINGYYLLVEGALLKHHRSLDTDEMDDIADYMIETYGMTEVFEALIKMVGNILKLEENEHSKKLVIVGLKKAN